MLNRYAFSCFRGYIKDLILANSSCISATHNRNSESLLQNILLRGYDHILLIQAIIRDLSSLIDQLKNTFEFKQKGFKGNTRGSYIHEPFLTLHDLLCQTPDSVALNIEISKGPCYLSFSILNQGFPRVSNAFRSGRRLEIGHSRHGGKHLRGHHFVYHPPPSFLPLPSDHAFLF